LASHDTIELTTDEVLLLRFTSGIAFEEESAFGPLRAQTEPGVLEKSARSLVEKRLADRKTYRADRELLRRILIASQPDCRIILLATTAGGSERLLDLYGRAGAYVAYAKSGHLHRLGPPLELIDVFDEVMAHFTPRRASGDFIELRLTSEEYFAFSAAAAVNQRLKSDHPIKSLRENTFEGLVSERSSRTGPAERYATPVLRREAWRFALHGLAEKGAMKKIDGDYQLRGYLRDLASGIAHRTRHVLTRLDFGADDWIVRDATLVHVPGSLFWLNPTSEGGLTIREVDPDGLKRAVRSAIEEVSRDSPPSGG
jgi:hypothetical protein